MATTSPGRSRPPSEEGVDRSVRIPRLSYRDPHRSDASPSSVKTGGHELLSEISSSNTANSIQFPRTISSPTASGSSPKSQQSNRSIMIAPDAKPPPLKSKSGKAAIENSSFIKSRKASMFSNIFSTKEPSTAALMHMEEQLRKQQAADGRINPVGMPGVSSAKMPEKVPKVNSKWDGLPTVQRERLQQEKQRVGRKSSSTSRSDGTTRERRRSFSTLSSSGSRGETNGRYRTHHGNMSISSGAPSFDTVDSFDRYRPVSSKSQPLRSPSLRSFQGTTISAIPDVPKTPALPEQYRHSIKPKDPARYGVLVAETSFDSDKSPNIIEGSSTSKSSQNSESGISTSEDMAGPASLPMIDEGIVILPDPRNEGKESQAFKGLEQVYLVSRDDKLVDLVPQDSGTQESRPFLAGEAVPLEFRGNQNGKGKAECQKPARQSLRAILKGSKTSAGTLPPTGIIESNLDLECSRDTSIGRLGLNYKVRKDPMPAPWEWQGLDMKALKGSSPTSNERQIVHSVSPPNASKPRRPTVFNLFGKGGQ